MKLIAPDSLSDAQNALLRQYSRVFPAGAVCVNVMVGGEEWDLRPLVLHQGRVSLFRASMLLDPQRARTLAADLEGFSMLFAPDQRVHYTDGEQRFLVSRPFYPQTLQEALENGSITGQTNMGAIVRSLIQSVARLSKRSIAHGHISPANIALDDEEELILVDPVFGALHHTHDVYLPPELNRGSSPDQASDLYSLGRMIRILLGDDLTARQSALVDQLLLPSPRQRPPLVEVAVAFGVQDVNVAPLGERDSSKGSTGKVLKSGRTGPQSFGAAQSRASDSSEPTANRLRRFIAPGVALALGIGALLFVKDRYPESYYSIARHIPLLVPERSAAYEADWASGDKGRMAIVARAAALNREPAAINTIVDDVLRGEAPEGIIAPLVRVGLNELWRDELRDQDLHAVIALAVAPLIKEVRGVPPLSALHPGVLLAVTALSAPSGSDKELSAISIRSLEKLPSPFGPMFTKLASFGVTSAGDPRSVALAALTTGRVYPAVFETLLSKDCTNDAQRCSKLLSMIEPIVTANPNPEASREVLSFMRDQGGELAERAGWFDIEELSGWEGVRENDKVRMALGRLPDTQLSSAQYFDLLLFPEPSIRQQAMSYLLEKKIVARSEERLLATVAEMRTQLQRNQAISLLVFLSNPPEKRGPLVSLFFDELKPSPDAVVLLLAARHNAAVNDLFNLEAARFLRKEEWDASLELLRILSSHPEPLARVLAYGKLKPSVEGEREILTERLKAESDPGCRKAIESRLAVK